MALKLYDTVIVKETEEVGTITAITNGDGKTIYFIYDIPGFEGVPLPFLENQLELMHE